MLRGSGTVTRAQVIENKGDLLLNHLISVRDVADAHIRAALVPQAKVRLGSIQLRLECGRHLLFCALKGSPHACRGATSPALSTRCACSVRMLAVTLPFSSCMP